MNNDLSWDKHVNSIVSKTVAKMYHLRKFASVIRDTLMCDKMYTSIIRLQMEYAAVVWHWGLKVKEGKTGKTRKISRTNFTFWSE